MKLTIDGKDAVVKSGTSIKLTRENYMLSNSGDYTLDVTLPLKGCIENQKIFGAAHRMEVGKSQFIGQRYPFRMEAFPMVIEGTAVVTSITNEEMKVQLLSGNSELNLRCTKEDGSDIYVDELELGKCWQTIWGDENVQRAGSYLDPYHWFEEYPSLRKWLTMFLDRTLSSTTLASMGITTEKTMFGNSDETDSICLPIYSAADGAWANQMALNDYKTDVGDSENVLRYWSPRLHFEINHPQALPGHSSGTTEGITLDTGYCLAPQPYMCYVVERVLKALGYTVITNAIRQDTIRKNVFIANCKATLEIKNMLPHWTVKEFLEEVMIAFNVKFEARDGKAWIQNVAAINHGEIELTEVVDEYSAEIDQESANEDLSAGNVGYKFDNPSPKLVLPEEVWENATVKEFDTSAALSAFVNSMLDGDGVDDRFKYLMIDKSTGEKMIFNSDAAVTINGDMATAVTVDAMGPLRRQDSRDMAKELRIVPVEMSIDADTFIQDIWVHRKIQTPGSNIYYGAREFTEAGIAMLTNATRNFTDTDFYNISSVISGENEEQAESKRDILEVGCLGMSYNNHIYTKDTGNDQTTFAHEGGFGIPYIMTSGQYLYWGHTPTIFMLQQLPAINTSEGGNTQTEWQIQFVDKGLFSTMATYLIRGRKFRCLKIEYTIDEKGLQLLKKGYFYEIS